MKSLLSKNLNQFYLYSTIILLCCAPILFFVMKFFYTKDLDELMKFRSTNFIEHKLPLFNVSEIQTWNRYNEDIQILPYKNTYSLDTAVEKFIYNDAERHPIYYRIIYRKVLIDQQPFILMCRVPMIEDNDLLGNLISQYGLIFFILLVSLGIAQRIISRKLWMPFYDSLGKIENYTLEQGIVPEFKKTSTKEFERLNQILTNLIANNLEVYKHQKEFIENASHELQTPLAVFQSQLDILLQEPELTEKQTQVIQSLYSVSSRLTRLNKNLLLLAKIDYEQHVDREEINFRELLDKAIYYLRTLTENEGIDFTVSIQTIPVLRANKILLESLINNLIVNAIRHNVEQNGTISISVNKDSLVVSNTGENQSLDTKKMFRRFNHTSEERKGNGLGLAIVYQICKLHHWKIDYSFQNSIHSFIVRF